MNVGFTSPYSREASEVLPGEAAGLATDVQIAEAVSAAKKADTAVVFVANKDTEAIDRNYAAHFAFIDYIFGTAVKSDRRFPGKYGVLGDYMPDSYVQQQLFPFTWKH